MTAATLAPTTAIHGLVDRCRSGVQPGLIARLPSGWAVMGERQVFRGYCLLLPDPVAPHLNALPVAARSRFLADMARVGDALLEVTGALRINYAMFGNVEPALHAHLFPRYADEPDGTRTAQPFALNWAEAPEFSVAGCGELRDRLRALLVTGAAIP